MEKPMNDYTGNLYYPEESDESKKVTEKTEKIFGALKKESEKKNIVDQLVIPELNKLSDDEFFVFLQKLPNYKERHNLPQETVDEIVKRAMEALEDLGHNFRLAVEIYNAIELTDDFKWNNPAQPESITDKAYRAVIKFYNDYPGAGHELENLFGQNHTVQPKILIETITDACGNPDTDPYLLDQFVYSLNYIFSFGEDVYDEALLAQFDFKNQNNFFKTGRFLDLIGQLFNVSNDYSFSEGFNHKLTHLLENVLKNNQGSYLLNIKVRDILSVINIEKYGWQEKKERPYFDTRNKQLFNPRIEKNEEKKKTDKEDLIDFEYLMNSSARDYIEKEFNINLDFLDNEEKFYFLKLIKQKNQRDLERVKSFTDKFKNPGFKSFLSIDYGLEMGDKILQIGEKIETETAKKIFDKYSELISELAKVEKILKESYSKIADEDEVIKIKEGILKKGKDLLVHFSDMVESGKEISTENILEDLNKVEAEATTFFLVFKTLKEEGELPPLSEIKGLSFEQKSATELSSEEQETIKKLYTENYKNNPELLNTLLINFEEKIINPETKFYVLKHNGKLRACIGFTPVENGSAEYAHSFNVEKNLRGISIGNVMMEKAMDREAEQKVIEGDCAAFEKIGAKYIESGFIGTSFYLYENNPSLSIVRDEKKNPEYWGKQMLGKEKELVEMISNNNLPEGVLAESVNEQKEFKMEPLSNDYVLTRYFKDESTKKWYAVFEKK